ncbi:MAG: dTDP-4-dehydrorhamnose 3,5-epimerase [Rhizobiales bacterium NRL2]|nr:MAG: dTDP-4-dehydrorhamnose 3,5-epimerase [Rhizobiales bacterium NRL2]
MSSESQLATRSWIDRSTGRLRVEATAIPEVRIVRPARHGDGRGFFSEVWNRRALAEAGIEADFVQDNHVLNGRSGTLRGLHLQLAPSPQAKLVRCLSGAILDVAVDVRRGSATFGRHVAVELSGENWAQLWVPEGFAHGYCTLTDGAEVIYKVTGYYDAQAERGVRFDDPALGIDWPVEPAAAILSEKDRAWPDLAGFGGV